jgi:hypothetical protein
MHQEIARLATASISLRLLRQRVGRVQPTGPAFSRPVDKLHDISESLLLG